MNLAASLVTLRKQHGLTQTELAEKVNVSRQAISRWEVGIAVPSTDNLIALSKIYGVSVDDILKGETTNVSQSSELSDSPLEATTCNESRKKRTTILACVLVFLIVAMGIVVGFAKSHNNNENENLPMENMTAEDDDGIGDTFGFE